MAGLTHDDTKHIAELAKLKLSPSEIEKFTEQLSDVLSHIQLLDEVDTNNTEPTSQTTRLENVLRDDEIKADNILTQEEALSGTENTKNGFITVKQILHND
jgi:aspartyl-tRNA(Asn)/glutamyl-tRNA(Gln) amidotransferase subunit C